ncbi:MAG: molybdopterin converting factor subunit 1 [Pseudomonadota bacterium]
MTRKLDIVYFAWVKERLGKTEDGLDIPEDIRTVEDVIDHLCGRGDIYDQVFADRSRLRFALDQQLVQLDAKLADARELAIFPPVTGG